MYIHEDGKLEPLLDREQWYTASVKVFEGDFTVESDRYEIVDTVMGLWYIALLNQGNQDTDQTDLLNLVKENKARVFPFEFFEDYIDKLEALAEEEKGALPACSHSGLFKASCRFGDESFSSTPNMSRMMSRRKSFEDFETGAEEEAGQSSSVGQSEGAPVGFQPTGGEI